MRKLIVMLMILSLLCATVLGAAAEQAAETLLYAPLEEGQETARIMGVESAPLPRTYESFAQRFTYFMEHSFESTPTYMGPYYSNGAWTYVMTDDSIVTLIKVSSDRADAQIQEIQMTGIPEEEYELLVLAASVFNSAAKCGTAGQNAMSLLLVEAEPERFFDFPLLYWQENGYTLTFAADENGLPTARVAYAEPAPVEAPADFDWDNPPTILDGPAYTDLNDYIAAHSADFLVEAATGDVEQDEQDDTITYAYAWEDCAVSVDVNKQSGSVEMITISSTSEETDSLWNRAMLLYLAAAQAKDEDIAPILNLAGGAGTWNALSELDPFAYLNNAALKCLTDDSAETPLYSAVICGAIGFVVAE